MEYSDYQMIEEKIRQGMTPGTRHKTRRDVGRIAGGCLVSRGKERVRVVIFQENKACKF